MMMNIKLISYPFVLMMVLGFSAVKAQTQVDKAPEYLFVITAKSAEITKISDNRYRLTMKHTDIDHVLQFSDRPYRIAKYITADELKKSWKIGKNSFGKDPPNAGLVAHGLKEAYVVELLDMAVSKEHVLFDVTFVGTKGKFNKQTETLLGGVEVFIDIGT